VHNRIFADTLIKTNIQLFEEYLNTYFIYHMTFLVNLKERLGLFLDHVLRKQPAEQGCNVVEVDDDFMRVAKSTNEQLVDPVIVLNSEIVKHDIQEEKIEPGESKSDDVIQIVIHSDGKPVEVAYPPIVEQVIDQVLETQVDAIIDQVIDQVIDTQITDQVVETPVEVDPETQVVTLNVSEETQTEPTIEEVFNPIIEHILGGSIASAVETAQAVETETAVETAPAAQAVETVPAVQPVSVPTKKKRPRKK
jgi:hypothetical protein